MASHIILRLHLSYLRKQATVGINGFSLLLEQNKVLTAGICTSTVFLMEMSNGIHQQSHLYSTTFSPQRLQWRICCNWHVYITGIFQVQVRFNFRSQCELFSTRFIFKTRTMTSDIFINVICYERPCKLHACAYRNADLWVDLWSKTAY